MRWLTLEDPAERARLHGEMDRFWQAFVARQERIDALFRMQDRWDLVSWMNEKLAPLTQGLLWEFGPGAEGGHRLVITPESRRHLRPLVAELIARAPKLPNWSFQDARPPDPPEYTQNVVHGRAGIQLGAALVGVQPGEGNRLDLRWHFPGLDPKDPRAFEAAFVATQSVLGERVLDEWVGMLDCVASAEGLRGWKTLPVQLHAARQKLVQALPEAPLHQRAPEGLTYTLWKMDPQGEGDFPRQDDLRIGKSCDPAMWTAAHARPEAFSTARFSRHDELYAYLKIDTREEAPEEAFQDKSEIEVALDTLLREHGVGAFCGGGSGLWYSYVDLMLSDLDAAIPLIRQCLRGGSVSRRSWLLFMDPGLASEWVGVYDDTPPPPV
jgi:hypothetical protein